MYDNMLLPTLGVKDWTHEQGSIDLLRFMIDQYNIDLEKHE